MPIKECQILPISNNTNVKSGRSTHWKLDICHLTFDIPYDSRVGFTLVELMVAISILVILAIIGLAVFTGLEKSARLTKVQQDLEAMARQIEIAREAKNQVFFELENGDDYADRDCRSTSPAYPPDVPVKDRPSCISEIKADWAFFTTMEIPTDPWGNIYTFDANEMEPNFYFQNNTYGVGPNRFCRWDLIKSAGPDGISWTDDDYIYYVPPRVCTVKEECYATPGTVLGGNRNNPLDTIDCKDPNSP